MVAAVDFLDADSKAFIIGDGSSVVVTGRIQCTDGHTFSTTAIVAQNVKQGSVISTGTTSGLDTCTGQIQTFIVTARSCSLPTAPSRRVRRLSIASELLRSRSLHRVFRHGRLQTKRTCNSVVRQRKSAVTRRFFHGRCVHRAAIVRTRGARKPG